MQRMEDVASEDDLASSMQAFLQYYKFWVCLFTIPIRNAIRNDDCMILNLRRTHDLVLLVLMTRKSHYQMFYLFLNVVALVLRLTAVTLVSHPANHQIPD